MRWSDDRTNIATALAAFAEAVTNPAKAATAKVGQYSYTYATLPDILDHIRPHLAAAHLAVLQSVGGEEGLITVTTTVVHVSGEWCESDALALPAGSTPQTAGGAITYARRYSLTAALGIAGEDDDDAAHASGAGGAKAKTAAKGGAKSKALHTEPQMRALHRLAAKLGMDHEALRELADVETLTELTRTRAAELIEELGQRAKDAPEAARPANDDGEALITTEQMSALSAIAERKGLAPADVVQAASDEFGAERLADLTAEQAATMIRGLQSDGGA